MKAVEFRARSEKLLSEKKRIGERAKRIGKGAEINVSIYAGVMGLIAELGEIEAKAEEVEKADIATKIRFSRKARKAGRGFWRLVREINALHLKGAMAEADAKQFGKSLEAIKGKRLKDAERDLERFRGMGELAKEMGGLEVEINSLCDDIDSRLEALKAELDDAREMANAGELEEKAKGFLAANAALLEYNGWRRRQAEKLVAMPVRRLVRAYSETKELRALGFPHPKDEFSLDELKDLLDKAQLNSVAKELLHMAEMKTEELKPVVGDHHLFRRLVGENARWLEQVSFLAEGKFLEFDFWDERKKEALQKAAMASKDETAISSLKMLCGISRAQYEEMKGANAMLSVARAKEVRPEQEIVSEINELEALMAAFGRGSQDESGEA
jgi:hypothetical protein